MFKQLRNRQPLNIFYYHITGATIIYILLDVLYFLFETLTRFRIPTFDYYFSNNMLVKYKKWWYIWTYFFMTNLLIPCPYHNSKYFMCILEVKLLTVWLRVFKWLLQIWYTYTLSVRVIVQQHIQNSVLQLNYSKSIWIYAVAVLHYMKNIIGYITGIWP